MKRIFFVLIIIATSIASCKKYQAKKFEGEYSNVANGPLYQFSNKGEYVNIKRDNSKELIINLHSKKTKRFKNLSAIVTSSGNAIIQPDASILFYDKVPETVELFGGKLNLTDDSLIIELDLIWYFDFDSGLSQEYMSYNVLTIIGLANRHIETKVFKRID
jgi:hypothetical protein